LALQLREEKNNNNSTILRMINSFDCEIRAQDARTNAANKAHVFPFVKVYKVIGAHCKQGSSENAFGSKRRSKLFMLLKIFENCGQ